MVLKIKGEDSWCQLSLASGVFLLFFGLCVIIGCVVSNLSKTTREILGKIDYAATALETYRNNRRTAREHRNIGRRQDRRRYGRYDK